MRRQHIRGDGGVEKNPTVKGHIFMVFRHEQRKPSRSPICVRHEMRNQVALIVGIGSHPRAVKESITVSVEHILPRKSFKRTLILVVQSISIRIHQRPPFSCADQPRDQCGVPEGGQIAPKSRKLGFERGALAIAKPYQHIDGQNVPTSKRALKEELVTIPDIRAYRILPRRDGSRAPQVQMHPTSREGRQ